MVTKGKIQLFALLYEQCLPEIQTCLKSTTGYKSIDLKQGGIELLSYIRTIMYGVEQHLHHIWDMIAVEKALFC